MKRTLPLFLSLAFLFLFTGCVLLEEEEKDYISPKHYKELLLGTWELVGHESKELHPCEIGDFITFTTDNRFIRQYHKISETGGCTSKSMHADYKITRNASLIIFSGEETIAHLVIDFMSGDRVKLVPYTAEDFSISIYYKFNH